MRLSGWTLIFPSQKSHSDRLLAEFTRVTMRANFKGTGTIQLGFHIYGRKGYIGTFPGRKLNLDSPAQSVPLESVQLLGSNSKGGSTEDACPSFGLLCVYAYPGTNGEIADFTCETEKFSPDNASGYTPLHS